MNSRHEIECGLTDAVSDMRVLHIVQCEAANSPAQETEDGRKIVVDEDTFIA